MSTEDGIRYLHPDAKRMTTAEKIAVPFLVVGLIVVVPIMTIVGGVMLLALGDE